MIFAEMTAPAIRPLPRESTLIIAPIAAMEQHGSHLSASTVDRTDVSPDLHESCRTPASDGKMK